MEQVISGFNYNELILPEFLHQCEREELEAYCRGSNAELLKANEKIKELERECTALRNQVADADHYINNQ